jgi:hypothetical protein
MRRFSTAVFVLTLVAIASIAQEQQKKDTEAGVAGFGVLHPLSLVFSKFSETASD